MNDRGNLLRVSDQKLVLKVMHSFALELSVSFLHLFKCGLSEPVVEIG